VVNGLAGDTSERRSRQLQCLARSLSRATLTEDGGHCRFGSSACGFLEVELTDHVGYQRGDPDASLFPNSRNGSTAKTVSSEVGDVELASHVSGPGRPIAHGVAFFRSKSQTCLNDLCGISIRLGTPKPIAGKSILRSKSSQPRGQQEARSTGGSKAACVVRRVRDKDGRQRWIKLLMFIGPERLVS
jgi:hypothetical protein